MKDMLQLHIYFMYIDDSFRICNKRSFCIFNTLILDIWVHCKINIIFH